MQSFAAILPDIDVRMDCVGDSENSILFIRTISTGRYAMPTYQYIVDTPETVLVDLLAPQGDLKAD